jgi:hypothetical protein
VTLEGRSFIRRIIVGSALDGDRVIYQKAEDLEMNYRKKYRLDDIEDAIDSRSDNSTLPARARSRRHRSEPTRYPTLRKQNRRNRFDITKKSDVESDTSTQSTHHMNRRYRRGSAGPSMASKKRRKAYIKKDDLEAQIERLQS